MVVGLDAMREMLSLMATRDSEERTELIRFLYAANTLLPRAKHGVS